MRRAVIAQLANRLANKAHQLGDDLVVRGLHVDVARHRGEQPRVALGAAANHDRGTASRLEDSMGTFAGGDVARGDHRHRDELDELGRQGVVGVARVHLLCAARVQRQRLGAGFDEAGAGDREVARLV